MNPWVVAGAVFFALGVMVVVVAVLKSSARRENAYLATLPPPREKTLTLYVPTDTIFDTGVIGDKRD